MDVNAIRAVANAILYEGYMLYPYRPSALKNRSQGWTFGTLLPETYAATHSGELTEFRAEVLVRGAAPLLSTEVRFLHLRGSEARERTIATSALPFDRLTPHPIELLFSFPEAADTESARVLGIVRISAQPLAPELVKVTVSLRNQSLQAVNWDTRDGALRQALVSAHALVTLENGEFLSLLNPPGEYRDAVAGCHQLGVFPVLAGVEGERGAMLISPIILYDYPQIAAGSRGDFFDSSEIDEMLTLRVLTLTDAEKDEVRAAGERARALLQRTESLAPEDILNLHGIMRGASRPQE